MLVMVHRQREKDTAEESRQMQTERKELKRSDQKKRVLIQPTERTLTAVQKAENVNTEESVCTKMLTVL